ncbi:MAG: AMP-binding enzyme, partial [Janthinobacterium lividum]
GMLVPTTMGRIWRHPDRESGDVSSLESILHLGARCAPWLKRAWIDWLGPDRVQELYAGTESQGLATISGREWLTHPGSVGRAVPGSRFRVVRNDDNGLDDGLHDCAPAEVGEVLMRRDEATYSYVGAVADVRDGWHTLGDNGWLDIEGYLYIADRIDDVVVSGGVNVVPADVEAVLEEHPAVRCAVVVGRPDDDLGQRVHAVVQREDIAPDVGVDELDGWCRTRLDPEKRPRSWEFVDEPLRDDTGKVRRSRWATIRTPDPT